ncbi:cupin domain-containing protein [Syntrophomonas wolfei]|nr:cupin domain-containing protein [Syntrophomonas wolfei]
MNLFDIPGHLRDKEFFESLLPDRGILIERIISTGQASPTGFWYDQDRDELVMLLQGEAQLAWPEGRTLSMGRGDWLLIPAHERHRVERTSSDPPCIWLAIHGQLT